MRTCKKCGVTKEFTEFVPHPTGYTHTCKECAASFSREWHKKNKERRQKVSKERRQTPYGKAVVLLGAMRSTCRKLGFEPPEFTALDIEKRITNGTCDQTGIPFDLSHSGPSLRNPFAPSPDRINPKEGYTKSNVQWVCWIYNIMKCDFTQEDISKFIQGLIRRHCGNSPPG